MARGREVRRPRPGGLLQRRRPLEGGPGARQPPPARGDAARRSRGSRDDRHPAPERIGVMLGFQTGRGRRRPRRASSRTARGTRSSSGRRWPPARWPARPASRRSGRGAGPRTAPRSVDETRKARRASTCGRATPPSATRRRSSGTRSTSTARRGRSSCRPGAQCRLGDAGDRDGGDLLRSSGSPATARSRSRRCSRAAAESPYAGIPTSEVLDGRARRDRGQLRGQRRCLPRGARAGGRDASPIARAILGDELRRLRLEARMRARAPSAGEVSAFYFGYPDVLARAVRAQPAPWWLGGRERGPRARAARAGAALRDGRAGSRTLRALDGTYRVDVLGDVRPLGHDPVPGRPRLDRRRARAPSRAEPPSRAGRSAARRRVLRSAICRGDDFPVAGTIRLSSYLPFLALAG